MAARTWFTKDNTPPEVSLRVLNTAARLMADGQVSSLSRSDLTAIRCAYADNLSPREVCEAAVRTTGHD